MRHRPLFALVLLACSALVFAPNSRAETPAGQELFLRCINCHGADGQGMTAGALKVPLIAGLDAWYVEGQLNKFRTDVRGAHPDDMKGLMMRAMSRSLADDAEVKAVAVYVSGLPRKQHQPDATADVKRGQQLYAMVCMACHGANSQGNPDPNIRAPSQVALEGWYIQEQLAKFRTGVRGNLKDLEGMRMVPMVRDALPLMAKNLGATLAEADRDIIAYISTLSGKP